MGPTLPFLQTLRKAYDQILNRWFQLTCQLPGAVNTFRGFAADPNDVSPPNWQPHCYNMAGQHSSCAQAGQSPFGLDQATDHCRS